MNSKDFQLTFLTIRYLALIGETLAKDLKDVIYKEGVDPKKIIDVLEACFDRVEHIAQYAVEENSWTHKNWKTENLIKDVEWLLFVMQDNQAFFEKGLSRGKTRPSRESVENLLIDLKASLSSEKLLAMTNKETSESTIIKQAHIGGYGIGVIPVEAPPAGMATIVLFVPMETIVGKTPVDLQRNMLLPWSASDGSGHWFEKTE